MSLHSSSKELKSASLSGPNSGGGVIWYVNNASSGIQENAIGGSDGNSGRSPLEPFSTVQKAVDSCVSGRGDVVVIFPGTYAENVTITSKDYVTLQGALAPGYARPDIAPTTGSALVVGNSQGVVLRHVRFTTDADADVVKNEGNGFLMEDCVFDGSAQAGTNGLLRLQGDASDDSYTASEGLIKDCLFRGSPVSGLIFKAGDAPGNGVGCTDVVVLNCRFYNNTGADIATQDNAGDAYSWQDGIISGCWFNDTDKAVYLDMDQNTTDQGLITGCYFADDAALDATKCDISGTSIRFVGNYNAIGVVDGSAFDN